MGESVARRRRRYEALRAMLEKRYRELASQIRGRIRDGRAQDFGTVLKAPLSSDSGEVPETTVDDDIDLALTELKTETLRSVAAALTRLDEGTYGYCSECDDEIPEARLKAMPFAIRCRECESTREEAARARSAVNRDRLLRALS